MTSTPIRTRFAPSPTGYLHVGGARTALYCWAFARHHGGTFVLRIEDTDLERSTPEAVQAILDGMSWLGLHPDEGPFYQMQRMDRYRQVLDQLLASGQAYRCYASPAELDAMREAQRAAGLKPRYDGRWRPERAAAASLVPPEGVSPVIRFRTPDTGEVSWEDGVKGQITIRNEELDDLILARPDGTPTYNFCVVVDDFDMRISHVIRGDDHINNTPRQIHILRALQRLDGLPPDAPLPVYAHLPMIHGPDGEKLSKRHGAVSVMQYDEDGYLPEALLNYLARLGWSHGDDEIISLNQLVEWFGLDHCSRSAAQFDFDKLKWLNAHYLKLAEPSRLAAWVAPRMALSGLSVDQGPPLEGVCALLRDRCSTLREMAEMARMFYEPPQPDAQQLAEMRTEAVNAALLGLQEALAGLTSLSPEEAAGLLKAQLAAQGLKMPALAMPLRLILLGRKETPAIDKVISLLGPERVRRQIGGLLR